MNRHRSRIAVSTFVLLLLAALAAPTLRAEASGGAAPDYWPTCPSPQPIAPIQPAGATNLNGVSDVAWNGREYGVVWTDMAVNKVYFRRFYADATPAGAAVQVSTSTSLDSPHVAWNGSSYGVAFSQVAPSTNSQAYFALVTVEPTGTVTVAAPVKVSHVSVPESTSVLDSALASGPSGFAVVWTENVAGQYDIWGTLLDPSGNLIGLSDIVICNDPTYQVFPSITWVSGASRFDIVWRDSRSGEQIYGNWLNPNGTIALLNGVPLVTASSACDRPVVVAAGSAVGLAWQDWRDGNYEVYFALFEPFLSRLTSDTRLTTDVAFSEAPRLVWTGAEWDVFFQDSRGGGSHIWMAALDASGTFAGVNTNVMPVGYLRFPGVAFGRYGFLATAATSSGGGNFVQPIGCMGDWGPPTCPMNFVAYSVTATTASIAWIASGEDYSDIAYYEVYRNSSLLGITSNTLWNDSGLSTGVTYNYYVRPVNAAQMVNTTCTNSIYVKASASLTLTMSKSEANARLDWTDATLNSYNVFRGTNPLVMSQITSTPTWSAYDPNVLVDNVDYYYTVDEPGQ